MRVRWVEAELWASQCRAAVEPLLLALSLLTLVTGLVDAACYLGLGRVFTANMTGNVVLLAFGATGAQRLPVLAPTVSLVVFLVGAATVGGSPVAWSGRPAPRCRRRCGAAGSPSRCYWSAAGGRGGRRGARPAGPGGGARRYVVIGLLAAGLELQNAATPNCRCCDFTAPRLIVPDIDGHRSIVRTCGCTAVSRRCTRPKSRSRRWRSHPPVCRLEGILTSAAHHHENRRPLWVLGEWST